MEALTPEDPSWIGHYRLLARLGAGGMGTVYLGRSPAGRTAAVKVIHSRLAHDPEFRRRFRAEVRAAQRVDGAFTAPVLDFDTDGSAPWLATGYVPGLSLEEAAGVSGDPLPAASVWWLAAGLAAALQNIHDNGLVHRDLKPSNVMLTLDGPRVIEFGVARVVDASVVTRTGAVIGSPGFMSPEQVRGLHAASSSDVFSLGSVLAFAATGRAPFGDSSVGSYALMLKVVQDDPDLTGVPEGLAELIRRCMSKDPAVRPSPGVIASAAAKETAGRHLGAWLPPELIVQIGKRTSRLLDLGSPPGTQLDGAPPQRATPPGTTDGPRGPAAPGHPYPYAQPTSQHRGSAWPHPAAPVPPWAATAGLPIGGPPAKNRRWTGLLVTAATIACIGLLIAVWPRTGGLGGESGASHSSGPSRSAPATGSVTGSPTATRAANDGAGSVPAPAPSRSSAQRTRPSTASWCAK